MTVTINHFLIVSFLLFTIGLFGVLVRRNFLTVLMSVELMMNAVNLNLVAFSKRLSSLTGQVFSVFVITIAAGEAAIGLALTISLFRQRKTLNIEEADTMQGGRGTYKLSHESPPLGDPALPPDGIPRQRTRLSARAPHESGALAARPSRRADRRRVAEGPGPPARRTARRDPPALPDSAHGRGDRNGGALLPLRVRRDLRRGARAPLRRRVARRHALPVDPSRGQRVGLADPRPGRGVVRGRGLPATFALRPRY